MNDYTQKLLDTTSFSEITIRCLRYLSNGFKTACRFEKWCVNEIFISLTWFCRQHVESMKSNSAQQSGNWNVKNSSRLIHYLNGKLVTFNSLMLFPGPFNVETAYNYKLSRHIKMDSNCDARHINKRNCFYSTGRVSETKWNGYSLLRMGKKCETEEDLEMWKSKNTTSKESFDIRNIVLSDYQWDIKWTKKMLTSKWKSISTGGGSRNWKANRKKR